MRPTCGNGQIKSQSDARYPVPPAAIAKWWKVRDFARSRTCERPSIAGLGVQNKNKGGRFGQ
jgi:hypothetical protein